MSEQPHYEADKPLREETFRDGLRVSFGAGIKQSFFDFVKPLPGIRGVVQQKQAKMRVRVGFRVTNAEI